MNRIRPLLRLLMSDVRLDEAGWASVALSISIRRTVFALMLLWQAVMIFALFGTLGWGGLSLALAHVALALYAVLAFSGRAPVWAIPLGMGLLGGLCYLASGEIDSLLVFAACWQINFASCIAGLLILHRWIVPAVIGGGVLLGILVAVFLPGWGVSTAISLVVTQLSIIVALRLGLPALLELAAGADADETAAASAAHRVEVARGVSRQVAEETRALHDTAINTLAAIAVGGAATADADEVRAQCARDVTVLRALRGERTEDDSSAQLQQMFQFPGLPVRRTGLNNSRLTEIEDTLDTVALRALLGCVREAITNATKHSGADWIDVNIAADATHLTISVRDSGVGFDGVAPPGRGLENSLLARARDVGATARIESNPGTGTQVTVTMPLVSEPTTMESMFKDSAEVVTPMQRRAGLLWALGVTVVSILLTAAGAANHHLALFPMIAIMAISWGALRLTRPTQLHGWAWALLIAANCTVFFLSAAATEFGVAGSFHWQALAATGPFVLLLSYSPPRRWLVGAAAMWVALMGLCAGRILPQSASAAGIVLVAGLVGLGFSFVWWRFQRAVADVAARASSSQRRAFEAKVMADTAAAAQTTYRRWLDAGLDDAIALLDSLADGSRPATSPDTIRASADEETYLRQLVLIDPELIHLGQAMLPMQRIARDRDIRFRVRLGAQDAPDELTAQLIATTVRETLASTPTGGSLAVSVFPVGEGIQLTLIGPTVIGNETSATHSGATPKTWRHRTAQPGLLQLDFARASGPSTPHQAADVGMR